MTDERVKTTQGRWAKLAARLRYLGDIGAAQRFGARLVGASGAAHEVHTNLPAASGRRARGLLVAALLMAALGTFATSSAYAGGLENFCGSTLLEKGHFCHSEFLGSEGYMFLISGENLTNSNPVCVGPVEWNGKEYTYPYGWSCGTGLYSWEFTPIGGVAAAVENPNSTPEKIGGAYLWSYLPAETTGSASGITSEQATLNGTVSAKGSETHYWFEYGKTTSYGSSTKNEEAGFSENKAVSATITGLEGVTTYHCRLVAKNRAGTTYGSDQTFKTYPSGARVYFVAKSDDKIHELSYNLGVGWSESAALTAEVANETSPSAFWNTNGQPRIYFVRKSDDKIHELSYNTGVGWSESAALTAEVASKTSPSAFAWPEGGARVYFVAKSDGKIRELSYSTGVGWSESAALTAEVASKTSPSAFAWPEGGARVYFVRKSDGKIRELSYSTGVGWSESAALTAEVASETSPSAFAWPEGGARVYFVAKGDDKVHQLSYNTGIGWSESAALTAEVASKTSPSAFAWPEGGARVYFVAKGDDKVHQLSYNTGIGWSESAALTAEVASETSPSAFEGVPVGEPGLMRGLVGVRCSLSLRTRWA